MGQQDLTRAVKASDEFDYVLDDSPPVNLYARWFCQLGMAPFDHLLRNTFCGSETETQGGGLSFQTQEMAVAGAFFHRSEDAFW